MPHATPRPWIAGNAANGRIFSTWGIFAGGKRIATVRGGPDVANAALIVRAVNAHDDLVKAVKELLTYIEADNQLKVVMYPQSIEFARNILKEATR